MKYQILFLLSFFIINLQAQDITGDWYGTAEVMGQKMRIVFHISEDGAGYTSTMDSPDQNAKGIAVKETLFENPILTIKLPAINFVYKGTVNEGFTSIEGNATQGGFEIPLTLSREAAEKEAVLRPQEPLAPFPYHVEEVSYPNTKAGVQLSGTLTLPSKKGKHPVVILISGSGPSDRNQDVFGHKTFLVLADYLTRQGIGVLRYDDRGVGKSTGDHSAATSADLATDAQAGFDYLRTRKDINRKKIGLIGHSEGGMIAPMVAAKNKKIDHIILLAGPGIPTDQLMLLQREAVSLAQGIPAPLLAPSQKLFGEAYQLMKTEKDLEKTKTLLHKHFMDGFAMQGGAADAEVDRIVQMLTNPWMYFFLRQNPDDFLKKVKCPVLAINGSKDLQVISKENLAGIQASLKNGKCKSYKVNEIEGLNHLFQECETGSIEEYNSIEQTFSPKALTMISDWLAKQ